MNGRNSKIPNLRDVEICARALVHYLGLVQNTTKHSNDLLENAGDNVSYILYKIYILIQFCEGIAYLTLLFLSYILRNYCVLVSSHSLFWKLLLAS